jgi:uncharacterized membrane protein (UPF0182 family)
VAPREVAEEPRPPARLVLVFLVAAFLIVVRTLVEVFLFGDLFFVAAFLTVVRALVAVFLLGGVFRLATDAAFFFLALVARFFLVKPEAAPPRAPIKAPATAPPRALPATPLASSAVSELETLLVRMSLGE